ncbi:hypothetical protein NPIL_99001 [Nephila pilipes]|uniref:Uncharacterized protein n=1 Tax=Nephila pilipes TaxID=299642 RepID=A0A8X6QR72_NEPPI|nr:hypothetical protein NPIL_99001 [Nephila pilipes]
MTPRTEYLAPGAPLLCYAHLEQERPFGVEEPFFVEIRDEFALDGGYAGMVDDNDDFIQCDLQYASLTAYITISYAISLRNQ